MLGFHANQRYYVYAGGVDMRKGVYSLCGLIRNELNEEPTNGSVFVFFSKSYQTVKLLVWDQDGYAVYGKWLSKGRFEEIVNKDKGLKQEIKYHHLVMLLSGISLLGIKKRPRYEMNQTG